MCTYNGARYLREQLNSFLAQTRLPDELVVCDDASTDATVSILQSFKETSPFPVTIIVNEKNLRVCKNFEKAISNCTGDIIALSDQDDIWVPRKLATLVDTFEKHPGCGYVFSNADLIDEMGNEIGRDLWTSMGFDKRKQRRYLAGNQVAVMLRGGIFPYGMTMAFRASFKSRLKPFECRFFLAGTHDHWIALFLSAIGAYGVALPCSLAKYRQHSAQLASASRPLGFVDLLKMKRSAQASIDEQLAEFLDHLTQRLIESDQDSEAMLLARKLFTEKAIHLRARVRANSSEGFQRIRIVLGEALSGRYGKYSRSFKSILKDLVSN